MQTLEYVAAAETCTLDTVDIFLEGQIAGDNLIYFWKSLASSPQEHFEIISARLGSQTASDVHWIQGEKMLLSM